MLSGNPLQLLSYSPHVDIESVDGDESLGWCSPHQLGFMVSSGRLGIKDAEIHHRGDHKGDATPMIGSLCCMMHAFHAC